MSKTYELVCKSTLENGVVQMDPKEFGEMVSREMRDIRCCDNVCHKAHKAMLLGDMCRNCGYPFTALKVYRYGLRAVYDEEYAMIHHKVRRYMSNNMYLEHEAKLLAHRIDMVLCEQYGTAHAGEALRQLRRTYADIAFLEAT